MTEEVWGKTTYWKPFDTFLKGYYTKDIIGVEIGVETGFHAKVLLDNIKNLKMIYLVDPYEMYMDGRIQRDFNSIRPSYITFKNNLKIFPKERVNFIKKKGLDALDDIPNELDFVYIDGNHSYDVVKQEINEYYKKLRVDGLLGGDDYHYSRHPGVTTAIDEFLCENGLQIEYEPYKVFTGKTPEGYVIDNDWWIIKK